MRYLNRPSAIQGNACGNHVEIVWHLITCYPHVAQINNILINEDSFACDGELRCYEALSTTLNSIFLAPAQFPDHLCLDPMLILQFWKAGRDFQTLAAIR